MRDEDIFTRCLICGHPEMDHSAGGCHNTEPCLCKRDGDDNPAGAGCAVVILAAAVVVCALIGTWSGDLRWWSTALIVGVGAGLAFAVHKLFTL